MWPWGHLAVGYLVYAVVLDRRLRRPPEDLAVVVLAATTQLPDVVDKTLAWNLGVLPNGRSLAHSALVATLVIAVVGAYLRSRGLEELSLAFGTGYYTHLAADAFQPLATGRWTELAFLGWPILPAVEYSGSKSVVARFAALGSDLAAGEVSAFLAFELGLVVLAVALWASHGWPGLGILGRIRPDRTPSK